MYNQVQLAVHCFTMTMSAPLLLESWQLGQRQSWSSSLSEIDHLLDSQRRFQTMLADADVFYSRSDLRMFIDRCRAEARTQLLAAYRQGHAVDGAESQEPELVLHAAAKIKVSPLNARQLIKDYSNCVRGEFTGSVLHVAAAARGAEHAERLRPFLDAFPAAIRMKDGHGMVPLQLALLHGTEVGVVQLLAEAFPAALEQRFLPRPPVPVVYQSLVGLLPFHVACCRGSSLDVIFWLLVKQPGIVLG